MQFLYSHKHQQTKTQIIAQVYEWCHTWFPFKIGQMKIAVILTWELQVFNCSPLSLTVYCWIDHYIMKQNIYHKEDKLTLLGDFTLCWSWWEKNSTGHWYFSVSFSKHSTLGQKFFLKILKKRENFSLISPDNFVFWYEFFYKLRIFLAKKSPLLAQCAWKRRWEKR